MDTTQFMALCDGIPAEARVGAPKGRIAQEERVRIKEPLTRTSMGEPYADFMKLRTGFIYLQYIDESKDYSPYYYILEKISEHFNGSTKYIAEWSSQAWKDVIAYCKSLPEYPRTNAFTNECFRTRERERAKAATRLTVYGAIPAVVDCELEITNLKGVYQVIEELITEIGGVQALEMMLSELPFNSDFGRYVVPHQGNQTMPTFVELEKPYGFLFNLCLKHIKDRGTGRIIKANWAKLASLATDLCIAVYDSQKFEIWSDIVFQPEIVVNIVHEMVLRFNIYTLPQTIVSFTLNWCRYLLKQTLRDGRCDGILEAKMNNLEAVMNWAINASDNKVCRHIKRGSKESQLLLSKKDIIEDRIIKKAEDLNVGYETPEDFDKVNAMMYPIIERGDEYILLPKPLAVWNWYEAIYNIICSQNKDIRNNIGYLMEDFIRNRMKTHGIAANGGEYSYDTDTEGEVDFLIEATKADAIIESKKKSFTRNARKGDDYYIWGDMFEFIYSQMQCARLEHGVKKFGPITLTDKKTGDQYQYKWKATYHREPTKEDDVTERERYVVKATMTLKEYGPMQDKVVLARIIESLVGRRINATFDPADTTHNARDRKEILETFDEINAALAEMSKYYAAIGDKQPTFFCRFYSMEQVYFLINEAKSQDHFVELLRGCHATMGTENFWNEYLYTGMFS